MDETPERFHQLEELYHAALELPADKREAFLHDQCPDSQLRREVELLLDRVEQDASFLKGSPWAQTVSLPTHAGLTPGAQLGPYRIEALLGCGGMGQVFRAEDTRLGRPVAIKVALHEFSERFEREARAIASLNHPHICTLYDVGPNYLVMELLHGQTLRERIASGDFSNEEILNTIIPILEALEAAHDAGIVHRDIKPANVFLTSASANQVGTVKILDFGLAKTSGSEYGSPAEAVTAAGMTVGTVAYMSPEQLRGKTVDGRSDLFACGAVLYEMATRRQAFEGANWVESADAVLNREVRPAAALNRNLLPEIARVIDRALEKDPALRFQTAADMRAELGRIRRKIEKDEAPDTDRSARAPNWRYLAVALAVVVAAAGAVWYVRTPRRPVTSPSEYIQLTNFDDSATAPALSPDGRMVAFFRGGYYFLGTGQIFVKLLPNGESKQLTNNDGVKYGPVFTPDGSRVAYTLLSSASKSWDTWTVPVLGGPASRLMPNAAGLSWIGAGRVLFSEIKPGTAMHMGIVTALESRAEEREIYFPVHERAMAHYSWLSPNRKSVLIVEMDRTASWQRCRLVPMEGGPGTQVGPQGACMAAAWSPDGQWMYFDASVNGSMHLWRQRVRDGAPEQLTFGPTEEQGLAMAPDGKSVVTSIGNRRSSVWTHDATGDHRLSVEGSSTSPKLSADGKRLFYLLRKSNSAGGNELWSLDVDSGKSEALVTGSRLSDYDISGDEKQVAFTAYEPGAPQIFVAPLDRSWPPRAIARGGDEVSFAGSGELVFRQLSNKINYLVRIRTDGSGFERALDPPVLNKESVSPDGEWVIVTGEGVLRGTLGVSLRNHVQRRICAGLCWAGWSADGKLLYVSTRLNMNTSAGRTLVIPIPRGFGALQVPSSGLDSASDEDSARFQSIPRVNMCPGSDPRTYAFRIDTFSGNLFQIPLH